MNLHARKTVAAALAMASILPAGAQGLPDPTRPPPSIFAPRNASGSLLATPGGPQLQSILIGRHPGGRHVAVIDGQTIALGGKFKGAVLTRITEGEVVLVSGTSRQVLKLYPTPPTKK
ncbi:MAG: hypothetical protein V4723_05665 [Pseudomonadota bacterium]